MYIHLKSLSTLTPLNRSIYTKFLASLVGRERDDSREGVEESKEEPCARTTPQEKPLSLAPLPLATL